MPACVVYLLRFQEQRRIEMPDFGSLGGKALLDFSIAFARFRFIAIPALPGLLTEMSLFTEPVQNIDVSRARITS